MTETIIDNQQKYENYKEQFQRLNKALANGFNLEAMFIEYAIMEDRTESILRHGNLWEVYLHHRKGRGPTIDSKVKYIQKRAENKQDVMHRYFADDLLDQVLVWKEERNRLIHALLKQQFEHNEISALATQGNELVKALRSRSGSYNRAVEKAKANK
jgi:hypothetical protein